MMDAAFSTVEAMSLAHAHGQAEATSQHGCAALHCLFRVAGRQLGISYPCAVRPAVWKYPMRLARMSTKRECAIFSELG